jgi:hypothetical protein
MFGYGRGRKLQNGGDLADAEMPSFQELQNPHPVGVGNGFGDCFECF